LSRQPTQSTNSGKTTIRVGRDRREIPVRFTVIPNDTGRVETYEATLGQEVLRCTIVHSNGEPNRYTLVNGDERKELSGNQAMIPFAGSDFWLGDLGLEFLYWPEQRLIRREMRRGQACSVLESVNPAP